MTRVGIHRVTECRQRGGGTVGPVGDDRIDAAVIVRRSQGTGFSGQLGRSRQPSRLVEHETRLEPEYASPCFWTEHRPHRSIFLQQQHAGQCVCRAALAPSVTERFHLLRNVSGEHFSEVFQQCHRRSRLQICGAARYYRDFRSGLWAADFSDPDLCWLEVAAHQTSVRSEQIANLCGRPDGVFQPQLFEPCSLADQFILYLLVAQVTGNDKDESPHVKG